MNTTSGDWRYDYSVPPNVGLILQNVSHATYAYAKDIRIAGIWVGFHDPAAPTSLAFVKPFRLNSAELGGTGLEELTGDISRPPDFPFYTPLGGVRADYKTSSPIFGSGSEMLAATQEFLFAAYGLDPPHEPGAVLQAARMFPLFKFSIAAGSGSVTRPATYLRVDYRFNFALDGFLFAPAVGPQELPTPPAHNQAGIFRDNEDVPFPIQLRPGLLGFSPFTGPDIGDVFAAAEKPLQYEVCTIGLNHGDSQFAGKPATWDNVHQWPSPYPGGLPSTPGAFHCAHLHWRWGAVAGDPPGLNPNKALLVPSAGQTQFKGLGWTSARGGPLIDRRIPDQSYRFAITKNFNTDLSTEILSTPVFEDLFTAKRALPDALSTDGDDLVLWMSIEVVRDKTRTAEPWEGALFIHGMYFAHNPEPDLGSKIGALIAAAGLRQPLLKPPPKRTWRRLAR